MSSALFVKSSTSCLGECLNFVHSSCVHVPGRVPTNLENLELSGNFVNLEKSGNLRCGQGIFCDMSYGSQLAYQ